MASSRSLPAEVQVEPLEDFTNGQNSLDSPKLLSQFSWQLMENCFPGQSAKPRNGINEKLCDTTARGYNFYGGGTTNSLFTNNGTYFVTSDGTEWLFVWTNSYNGSDRGEYQLEVWNITTPARSVLQQVRVGFPSYFSFTKLYNCLYCLVGNAISTNHTQVYIKNGFIVEYISNTWVVRQNGIDSPSDVPQVTIEEANSGFPVPLWGPGCCVFKNKMWVLGGYEYEADVLHKDVYSSTDGIIWNKVASNIFSNGFYGGCVLVYNDKIWAFGGNLVDKVVYCSSDGIAWSLVGSSPLPTSLQYAGALVFNNKMWIFGGKINGTTDSAKVYYSTDGITWTAYLHDLPFAYEGMAVTTDGAKIYLIGGYRKDTAAYLTKVYSATDGSTWSQIQSDFTGTAAGTTQMQATYYNKTFFAIGGTRDQDTGRAEVWTSADGVTWEAGTSLPQGKFDFGLLQYQTEMWLICGRCVDSDYTSSDVKVSIGGAFAGFGAGIGPNLYTNTSFTWVRLASSLAASDQTSFTEPICESPENLAARQLVRTSNYHSIDNWMLNYTMPDPTKAAAQGATHLRVWRTVGNANAAIAQGLSLRYTCDIAIANGAGYVYSDEITDNLLSANTNTLNATGLIIPMPGRFSQFIAGRFVIGGNTSNPGYWFCSILPQNVAYPQKYASLFDPDNGYVTCDPFDGQADSGIAQLGGDLLFFKERKIFVLDNGDFTNVPRKISSSIGCVCPESIRQADIPSLGGQCILFLSESGPAIILPGMTVKLLTEFRIAELWPVKGKAGLLLDAYGAPTSQYSRSKVFSAFYDSTWYIGFGDSADPNTQFTTPKLFGFCFGTEAKTLGAFTITFPQFNYECSHTNFTLFEPQIIIPTSNLSAFALSHKANYVTTTCYRMVKIFDPLKWRDTYLDANVGALSYSMNVGSRYLYVGPRRWNKTELKYGIFHLYFQDALGLTIDVYADGSRLDCRAAYAQQRQSGMAHDNSFRHFVGMIPLEPVFGSFFHYFISKVVPSDGAVEIFGGELIVDQTSDYDTPLEFLTASEENQGSTEFVQEADANPEENAYP